MQLQFSDDVLPDYLELIAETARKMNLEIE